MRNIWRGSAFSGDILHLYRWFCSWYVILEMLHTHTHTRLTALCPGLTGWAGTRDVKPIWILLKQETMSGSGISWSICKSAPRSRQIFTPAPHHSVIYWPDALPAARPTASKHWRQIRNATRFWQIAIFAQPFFVMLSVCRWGHIAHCHDVMYEVMEKCAGASVCYM